MGSSQWPAGIGSAAAAARIDHPDASIGEPHARADSTAYRKMADYDITIGIDHTDGIDYRPRQRRAISWRDRRPFRRQEAAQRQEPRDTHDDLAEDFILGCRYHGDGIGVSVGDIDPVVDRKNAGWCAATDGDAGRLAGAVGHTVLPIAAPVRIHV